MDYQSILHEAVSGSICPPVPREQCAVKGSSDVYVTGYKTTSTMMSEYPYLDDDDDEEEDEEDDEAAPQAVPLNSKLQRRAALIRVRFFRLEAHALITKVHLILGVKKKALLL